MYCGFEIAPRDTHVLLLTVFYYITSVSVHTIHSRVEMAPLDGLFNLLAVGYLLSRHFCQYTHSGPVHTHEAQQSLGWTSASWQCTGIACLETTTDDTDITDNSLIGYPNIEASVKSSSINWLQSCMLKYSKNSKIKGASVVSRFSVFRYSSIRVSLHH
jgi:hypothetical protein